MYILYILTYTVYAQFYKLPKRQGGRYMLEVSNLNKINPDSNSYLLDNITFYIPKGHICGVIGENGAGKTTLMRALMGLYSSSGSIVIDGCDMRLNEAAAKERLGIVFADDGFFDGNMRLSQIGKFYGQLYHSFNMELYLNYIEEFGLDKKQKYKKLSKGMKTRTQLAFALSHNAKLFLFDEPTAGLDKHFREKFLKLCTNLVADGEKSILIATHITEELDRIADYIAYMQKGRMLFYTESYKMCERFRIVTGEDYKCNLIPDEVVVYKEKNTYSTSAMVVNSEWYRIDDRLEKHIPDIREFMYYFVKGGEKNAEVIAEKYLNN